MLDIFPENILSESVVVTVWVGVLVVTLLNLRFGVTLSGLVIPGYVIPLLMIKPPIGVAILVEGITTYFLVKLVAEKLPVRLGINEMFGRDRFFAIVLGSIFVRILFDTTLFPLVSELLADAGLRYDLRSNLHSFGLIIVALIANQMWNGGWRIGLLSLSTYLLFTWLIIRFVLIELTNFNITTLGYMYEDIASSIFAAPKAYIILLTTAFIASRMNLRYGWDFNGILMPSLLALQWFTPSKIAATFAETLAILLLAHGALRIPFIKNSNIEGARQILFFFTLALVYKWLLGLFLQIFFPDVKFSDFYAFGYLLSTLLAIKIYQTGKPALVTWATLQVSLTGVIVATAIGLVLNLIPASSLSPTESIILDEVVAREETIDNYLAISRAELFASQTDTAIRLPTVGELEAFRSGFRSLQAYRKQPDENELKRIAGHFLSLGYTLERVEDSHIALREHLPERGWGLYVFNMQPGKPLVLEVPSPLDEVDAADTAALMYIYDEASALALAGNRSAIPGQESRDVLLNSNSVFQAFHLVFGRDQVLQIRGKNISPWSKSVDREGPILRSSLYIGRQLPSDINLPLLKRIAPDISLEWRFHEATNRQRHVSPRHFAELFLDKEAARRAYGIFLSDARVAQVKRRMRIDGYIQEWLQYNKDVIARSGSDAYRIPELYELLYFDNAVLTPLIDLINTNLRNGWSSEYESSVARLSALSAYFGYELVRYIDQSTTHEYIILREPPGEYRHWGTYVFRIGGSSEYLIQVPRPLYEQNTFEFGVQLFEGLNAKALMISGTHPRANTDGSANVIVRTYNRSLFNVVNVVLQREQPKIPSHTVQVRALDPSNPDYPSNADIIMAHLGAVHGFGLSPLEQKLREYFDKTGTTYEVTIGEMSTLGHEAPWNAITSYMPLTQHKTMDTIWVSAYLRRQYRFSQFNYQLNSKLEAAGIETQELVLAGWLPSAKSSPQAISDSRIQAYIEDFIDSENVTDLFNLVDIVGHSRVKRFIDRSSGQSFLVLFDKKQRVQLLANIQPVSGKTLIVQPGSDSFNETLKSYVNERHRILQWGAYQ